MKCSDVRTFFSQIHDHALSIAPIQPSDLSYFSANGYVLVVTKEDYDAFAGDVVRLSQMTTDLDTERKETYEAVTSWQQTERKEHSFLFHFENTQEKDLMRQRLQDEMATVSKEESELKILEAGVNELIQKKSIIDQIVQYNGGYITLTDMGRVILNDLNVRNYRVADEDFADFVAEIREIYGELRSIADKASFYVATLKPRVPGLEEVQEHSSTVRSSPGSVAVQAPSILWGAAIGLGKLQGDPNQIVGRFLQVIDILHSFDSPLPNKLMVAEVMTALASQDVMGLEPVLKNLDKLVKDQGVPKELSLGVAATIMAGRRYDGSYPTDSFTKFRQWTQSFEAAAILSVMNIPFDQLLAKFQSFRYMFTSWGYMTSEDTEIASAFLAIGELNSQEVEMKLRYIVEQLRNYLEYPLVGSAILASIPVFDSYEALDLMEKAVTLLTTYAAGLERAEIVALAIRMIHGVRNELVKQIDSTAKITPTPIQFTYSPGLFIWYYPVIIAHSSYHSAFGGMGSFHPAHSHGVGGFSG